jgi:NAD+ dependent glucose-6-phosphate dehydrogenase
MGWGRWGQAMWLSNRDLCQAMERAVLAEGVGFAVLNLMSENPGMRWDIATTKQVIGYTPRDGAAQVVTETIRQQERSGQDLHWMVKQLDCLIQELRW